MDLILYHNACPDGWAAAYICKKKYPEAALMGLNHGLPEAELESLFSFCEGKDVIMVDYSLRTRELNDRLNSVAKSFRILDHHKTAQAVLDGASYATFDMKRSGAGLAWDYLFGKDADSFAVFGYELNHPPTTDGPENPHVAAKFKADYEAQQKGPITGIRSAGTMRVIRRPWWVDYTEDQDLWNWALPNSQEINAYLMVQTRSIEAWDQMLVFLSIGVEDSITQVARLGGGICQYIEYYTRSVVAEAQEGVLVFEGHNYITAVLNIPYVGVSEAGSALCKKGYPVALLWFERGDGITQFSLRGDGSVDVSAIAKSFGGGGHNNAAGFQVSLAEGRALVDKVLGRSANVQTHCMR